MSWISKQQLCRDGRAVTALFLRFLPRYGLRDWILQIKLKLRDVFRAIISQIFLEWKITGCFPKFQKIRWTCALRHRSRLIGNCCGSYCRFSLWLLQKKCIIFKGNTLQTEMLDCQNLTLYLINTTSDFIFIAPGTRIYHLN